MSKKSLKKNYLFSLMYEVLAVIVPFITTPYVSRVMGPTAIGDYSYTNGIVSYFGLIALTGTATYGNRGIAIVQNDKKERSILFYELFFFRLFCTVLAFMGYGVLLFHSKGEYRILYFINTLLFLSWILDVSWFCQGMENFKVTAIRNSLVKILGAILVFIFIKKPEDVWLYTLIYVGSMVLGNVTMWAYVLKHIEKPDFGNIHMFKHTKGILQLFIPVIAVQIYTVMDRTMLGYLDNTTQVGYYTQGNKIISIAMTFVNAFIAILMPRISSIYAQNKKEELKKLIQKTLKYIFFLSIPMLLGCIIVIDQFVPIFFGSGYELVGGIIKILSILFLTLNLGRLFGTMLVATNRQNAYTGVTILAAVLNLLLNSIFLLRLGMGAIGVAIASVVSETTATVVQFYFVREDIELKDFVKIFVNYLIPAAAMSAAILVCKMGTGTNGIVSLMIQIVVGVIVYMTILLLKKDELVSEVLGTILKKMHIKQ